MKKLIRATISSKKISSFTIIINSLQITAALLVALLSIFVGDTVFTGATEQVALSAMALVVVWGAVLDIREAYIARRVGNEKGMIEEALGKLSELNGTLRAQRHDFMNHLQVVYSLMEMHAYSDAQDYIDKVYKDIQKVQRTLKTAIPAVNALLAAKLQDCDERGIATELRVGASWSDIPVPDWELCRVLGNLIDNAMDALKGTASPKIRIRLRESIQAYSFEVANNGPMIPPAIAERIFERDFTTKGDGHGLGLYIAKGILQERGGTLAVRSDETETAFFGTIPKPLDASPVQSD